MLVTVEFLGLARRLTGQKQVQLEITEGETLRGVARTLAARFPTLLSQVITPETMDLISPYYFNVGGRFAATSLEAPVDSAEPLILMFLEAGG